MIRQAHTYLAGAISGTVLVIGAIVGFVLLVSLQTVRGDWPLAGIVGSGDSVASRLTSAPPSPPDWAGPERRGESEREREIPSRRSRRQACFDLFRHRRLSFAGRYRDRRRRRHRHHR